MSKSLRFLCLFTAIGLMQVIVASEPSVASNGWKNIPGVVEGTLLACPVDTTIPTPPLGYVEYLPAGYNPADTTTKWPLIIYLCGAGEVGDGTNTAANGYQLYNHIVGPHGPLRQIVTQGWDYPAIVMGPQDKSNWGSPNSIHAFIQYVKQNYNVDANRISITGLCDGASGSVRYAVAYPGDISALFPTETGYLPGPTDGATLANIPMWLEHDFADQEVTCRYNSITWADQTVLADTGITSNVMSTYPSYGNNVNHYAVDADPVTGFPLDILDGPTWTMNGAILTSGSKLISLTQNSFGSVTYTQWSGSDAQPFAQITIGAPPSNNAKAGVMLRDSNSPGAKMVCIVQLPNNQVEMLWRDQDNGGCGWTGSAVGNTAMAKWVKLVRTGLTFTGSYSTDSINWTVIGSHAIVFDNTAYLGGLCLSSNSGSAYGQKIENLTFSGTAPGALTDIDIGSPSVAGSISYTASNSTYTIGGGGGDIWNTSDVCTFASTGVSGDQSIVAQIGVTTPPNVAWISYSSTIYMTRPYTGASNSNQTVTVQMPVGYNNNGVYDPLAAKWNWGRSLAFDPTKPSKHMFLLQWYSDHTRGSDEFYSAPDCYNWALSQSKLFTTIPVITTQPVAASANAGQPATFSVAATSPSQMYFQWLRGGVPISGATSSTYTLPSCSSSDDGVAFSVNVSNNLGTVASQGALLHVIVLPPTIITGPATTTVSYGQTAVFTVVVGGGGNLTYQWYLNTNPISGATSSSYTTPATTFSDNNSVFSVLATNQAGSILSGNATLQISSLPVIMSQPVAQVVVDGQQATFTVAAAGAPTLAYQWYQGTSAIAGANAASYSLTAPYTLNGTSYSVIVSNGAGSLASASASLTVAAIPPSITSQPLGITVIAGQPATFNVGAQGTAPLSYQWVQAGCGNFTDQDIGNVSTPGSFSYSQGGGALPSLPAVMISGTVPMPSISPRNP